MPFLQSSGAISINDIKTLFGGPASPALSNYYRGGTYIPSTKSTSTTVREPSSGDYYQLGSGSSVPAYYWLVRAFGDQGPANTNGANRFMWDRFPNQGSIFIGNGIISSYTSGIYTYYRSSHKLTTYDSTYAEHNSYFGIYRTYTGTTTTNINTNVPTSGQISISQFYGAEKP